MGYIGIFQIMEPRNRLKPDFETSVTFEALGIIWCGFHCCAQKPGMSSVINYSSIIYIGVSLKGNIFPDSWEDINPEINCSQMLHSARIYQ